MLPPQEAVPASDNLGPIYLWPYSKTNKGHIWLQAQRTSRESSLVVAAFCWTTYVEFGQLTEEGGDSENKKSDSGTMMKRTVR